MWQLTNQWQKEQRRALKKLGLTHAQFVVLAGILWLSAQPAPHVTQQQVSDLTKIDKMSLSTLTTTLIEKNLLQREFHPLDNRAYALTLTTKGRRLAIKAVPIVEGIDAVFFSTQTPGLAQLVKILQRRL
jgi:DNA-binding MarR family transcriptional regulator